MSTPSREAPGAGPVPEVLVDVLGAVAWVRLNRPARMNAVTAVMRGQLSEALRNLERDEDVGCLVLTGEGRAFCAGQDVAELAEELARAGGEGVSEVVGRTLRGEYAPIVTRLRTMPKPVVAALNGVAAGIGASLALACDIRIATPAAAFVQAFAGLALVPDGGASWLLPRMVGAGRAMEMFLTGRPLEAAEAVEAGLVSQVVPPEELERAAGELAGRLAEGPRAALAATRRAVWHAAEVDLEEAMEFESYLQEVMAAGADFKEGVEAFLAKRAARFGAGSRG